MLSLVLGSLSMSPGPACAGGGSFQLPAMEFPLHSAWRKMVPIPSGTLQMSSFCLATGKGQWINCLLDNVWCAKMEICFSFLVPFLFLFAKRTPFPHVLQTICSFQLFFYFPPLFFPPYKSVSLITINLLISHIWSSYVTSTMAQ